MTEWKLVPVEPDADTLGPGVYAVADILCASEYVNAPDASFVLALAHRAFADGVRAMLAAAPPPVTDEMVERAARAVQNLNGRWDDLDEPEQNDTRDVAHAALTAALGPPNDP